ncbi:MAG: xanthine dehydrogenase small subunit [Xanthobacteraceae bacterium]|nr:xanthine dehydrogenase small subunit [Xanthobacteraceae bacterium]
MRNEIRFLRGGREVRLGQFSPTLTLLDYLRLHERSLGTKEGCAEGDCGACTVVLRRCVDGHVIYEPVNSCILFAGQADGAEVIAVDDLANGRLHPVQQAMVETHGSQCGFCTPGFVMALFGLYHTPRHGSLTRAEVNDFIAGNLCRCTGYRPIVDAAVAACATPPHDRFAEDEPEVARRLAVLADNADVLVGDEQRFFAAPASIASLADKYAKHPDAVLVSGATDVGLWVTKQLRDLPKIIWLGRVRGLDTITDAPGSVTFGATVTHQAAMPYLAAIDPDLGALMRRFAGRQVRTVGTIGGNIANGSPIGDTPPALIALESTLVLQQGETTRTLPLEDFFIAYGRQDRRPGEFVRAVRVRKLGPDDCFRCYKISKRFDSDISAVMGAFRFTRSGDRISAARIAFGGMAATPRRAAGAEAALAGVRLSDPATWSAALDALDADFSPLDDQRGSARYRRDTARALFRKALIEAGGTPSVQTRVIDVREDAVVSR